MVLLCAGAACSLAGVWALAGLSERSNMRNSARVLGAAALGLLALPALYFASPAAARAALMLPLLFGAASMLGLVAGAAKLDGALAVADEPRALRRAAGLIAGSALSMAAIAAVSLELLGTLPVAARFGWACMAPIAAAAVIVFAQRTRLAGGGALALGPRALVLAAVGLLLLGIARFSILPPVVESPPKSADSVAAESPAAKAPAPPIADPGPLAPAPPPVLASAAAAPVPSVSATPGAPGELQIETVVPKGLLEADARGGVLRRFDRLQACLAEPTNQQSGALTLRVTLDGGGSVTHVRPTGGDLVDTPLAACLLPVFYQMGFAAPAVGGGHFEITLRAPPR
jgi:hypothetical protein